MPPPFSPFSATVVSSCLPLIACLDHPGPSRTNPELHTSTCLPVSCLPISLSHPLTHLRSLSPFLTCGLFSVPVVGFWLVPQYSAFRFISFSTPWQLSVSITVTVMLIPTQCPLPVSRPPSPHPHLSPCSLLPTSFPRYPWWSVNVLTDTRLGT